MAKFFQKYGIKQGKWPNELPRCLWAYHTTKRRATDETLFSLAFGLEAIIHPNVIKSSITALLPSIEQNSKEVATSLDLAEEKREQTITNIAAYQQQLLSSYNERVKIWQFQPEDLVLRKAFIITHRKGTKKMDPIWEGPYKISRVGDKSNYTLATMKQQKYRKTVERLQYEEVPCVTSYYIKARRLKQLDGDHLISRGLSSYYAVSTLQLSSHSFHSFFNEEFRSNHNLARLHAYNN
ncbi:uncharacterized protein [Pyrus communis]|uniref:uncharacterized protein n=1 Tax=Pyrus communis TaxID=23211 RepID=UPI0035C002F3